MKLLADLATSKVLFVTVGKDASTLQQFRDDFVAHRGKPISITDFCSDMSPAFIKGVGEYFVNAQLTFDKFHVMQITNTAVDEVRRQEQKELPELIKSRYFWLKNQQNLTVKRIKRFEELSLAKLNLKKAQAYRMRLEFQELFSQLTALADSFLKKWYFWATHSRLQPVKEAAYTINNHWLGILRWFTSRISNGKLEGHNSLVRPTKARTRSIARTEISSR